LWLRAAGVREFVVNLHHLGDQIEAELGDGSRYGVAVAYSREEGQILGTGGGLRQARSLLDDGRGTPIVVVNGKILLELDLAEVLARHRDSAAEATMVLRQDPEAARWGSLRLDAAGTVGALLGRELPGRELGPPLMFTGVHVFDPRFLDRIPPEGEQCVIRTAYRELFDQGRGLQGFVTDRYWWEHSTVERYLQGVWNVLEGRVALPFAEGPLRGVDPTARVADSARIIEPVWVGPGAVIEADATVGPLVQLGAGALVAAGAHLERTVVWDGVTATREVRDRVLVAAPAGC
jgi:NDP-sugar pyrophosphorylase family protein